MMKTRRALVVAAVTAAASVGACNDLVVTNPNSGETARVLGTANDAEALIGTYYKRWATGVYGSVTDLQGMAANLSMMNYSGALDNCQNNHLPFTGASNFNYPASFCSGAQVRLFTYMGEVNRVTASFLKQLNGGLELGSSARDARARAWANFLNGLALGYTAMMYDSGAVVTPTMDAEDPGVLIGHLALADSAAASFQRAIDEANKPVTGDQGFPIPNAWLPSPTVWTAAEFTKLVRSYRARIMANVAWSPAERAARNWAAIIADAQNGITSDHLIVTSTTVGPTDARRAIFDSYGIAHQMPPFFIGMADVSGSYAAWIATPVGQRGVGPQGFFMVTPDLRFPQGATRAAQQADFAISSCQAAGSVCKRYFVNRNGNDVFSGDGWGYSNYDFVRFHPWRVAGDAGIAQNGTTPYMVFAEIDLLRAEGLYRRWRLCRRCRDREQDAHQERSPGDHCVRRHESSARRSELRPEGARGSVVHGRRVRQPVGRPQVREADRDSVYHVRAVVPGWPRLGRPGREHADRLGGAVPGTPSARLPGLEGLRRRHWRRECAEHRLRKGRLWVVTDLPH